MKRLLDSFVLECLNTSCSVKGCQMSSKSPGDCDADESYVDHPTELGKRLALS